GLGVGARSGVCRAAFFVTLMSCTSSGGTPLSARRLALRCVCTRVSPLPAPAMIRSGPSVCRIAAFCSLLIGDKSVFKNSILFNDRAKRLFNVFVNDVADDYRIGIL